MADKEWVLVPREPTEAMIDAAWESDAADYVGEHKRICSLTEAWEAMLAAVPSPPADADLFRLATKLGKMKGFFSGSSAEWEALDKAGRIIDAMAAAPAPVRGTHCQNGRADVCLASQRDGVICADDECDIDSGIRAAAPEPVDAKKIISETIGFDFEGGELQTVNEDDLMNLAAAFGCAAPAPGVGVESTVGEVYLVATGETRNGQELYTRHEGAPPQLCDFETLYTAPPAPQGDAKDAERYRFFCAAFNHPTQREWLARGFNQPHGAFNKSWNEIIDAAIAAQAGEVR